MAELAAKRVEIIGDEIAIFMPSKSWDIFEVFPHTRFVLWDRSYRLPLSDAKAVKEHLSDDFDLSAEFTAICLDPAMAEQYKRSLRNPLG